MKAQTQELSAKLSRLTDQPGVYLMKDAAGEIIYIGKASSLKKRVSSYFRKSETDPKTRALVRAIADLECIVTDSEIEALLLESSLVKKHRPKFNIRLKDDKRYPYIAVTNEEYPRVVFTRSLSEPGYRYFGPYTDARAARAIIAMINATFKLKTCARSLPLKANERPCLNYQMKRCQGMCRNEMSREDYLAIVENAVKFLEGNIEPVAEDLARRMGEYAERREYEKAAKLRDVIEDIKKIMAEQKVFAPMGGDQDFIGIAIQNREAAIVVFEFRAGALLGRKIYIYGNAEYASPEEIARRFIIDHYRGAEIPARIVVPRMIEDRDTVERHLAELSSRRVAISTAKTADDRGIAGMVQKNLDLIMAGRSVSMERGEREAGLAEIGSLLGLPGVPATMECFDISNTQGAQAVASMVRFRDGLPDKKNYRRYRIRGYDAPNDPGMIHEVVARRLQRLINENEGLPDLLVIDGGATQLSRAMEASRALGLELPIISLAKRFEEIYVEPSRPPLRLPDSSPALSILKRLRDEAHRFAIGYHRKLRAANAVSSVLDEVPRIGEKKKRLILSHVAEPSRIRELSIEELSAIPGLGEKAARAVFDHFHADSDSTRS